MALQLRLDGYKKEQIKLTHQQPEYMKSLNISTSLALVALAIISTSCATPPRTFHNHDNTALVIESLDKHWQVTDGTYEGLHMSCFAGFSPQVYLFPM